MWLVVVSDDPMRAVLYECHTQKGTGKRLITTMDLLKNNPIVSC